MSPNPDPEIACQCSVCRLREMPDESFPREGEGD